MSVVCCFCEEIFSYWERLVNEAMVDSLESMKSAFRREEEKTWKLRERFCCNENWEMRLLYIYIWLEFDKGDVEGERRRWRHEIWLRFCHVTLRFQWFYGVLSLSLRSGAYDTTDSMWRGNFLARSNVLILVSFWICLSLDK